MGPGIISTFLILLVAPLQAFAADFANLPIFLKADQVLPADEMKGSNFKVDGEVRNDGLINFYVLDTDYGRVSAESTAELEVRIEELNALTIMEEMDRQEVFKESVVTGVKSVGEGVKNLVTSPVETTKEMVQGTGQFLSNIGQAFVSDDPSQDNALKVALGYDVAKRQFAYEFGINPYTDYEPVVDRLGEIARAAVAGGLAPKVALAAIDHPVAMVAQVSGTMRGMQKLVRDNPPNKLREINFGKLQVMGISENLANAFLDNYSFDPYEKTLLVGELEAINVPGREVFLSRADLATEKSTALFYRRAAQMMGGYHRTVQPAKAILETAGVLNLQTENGGRLVLAPVDYVFWTEKLAAKVDNVEKALALDQSVRGKELWVTGRVDSEAKRKFEGLGWKIVENAGPMLLGK